MIHNTVTPIQPPFCPPMANPIDASARPCSILARVFATPDPSLFSESFEQPRYTAEKLQRLNASMVGKAFHILNRKGELSRRGVVLQEFSLMLEVAFCDPLSGLLCDTKRVLKSDTAKWRWFAGVDESNDAYRDHFNVPDEEEAPSPRFIWSDRELQQIYFQEPN